MSTATAKETIYTPEELQHYSDEMADKGYFVIENILSPEELGLARAILDELFVSEADIGRERGWHTDLYLVSNMLPQKHPFFRRLPLHPRVLPLMRHILGPRVIMSSLNGFTMAPGSENQGLHIDQWESVPGMVLNINAMFCLDDYTVENGATRVVPGSQERRFDRSVNIEEAERETIQLTAKAGSLVAFNGGLWHAGSANRTRGYRRALHAYYCRPWVKTQWDIPASLSSDVIQMMTDDERMLYGLNQYTRRYDPETRSVSVRPRLENQGL